jgi:hypothetical protein
MNTSFIKRSVNTEGISLMDLLTIIVRQDKLPNYWVFVQHLYFEVLKKYLGCTELERKQILASLHCKSDEKFSEKIKYVLAKEGILYVPDSKTLILSTQEILRYVLSMHGFKILKEEERCFHFHRGIVRSRIRVSQHVMWLL